MAASKNFPLGCPYECRNTTHEMNSAMTRLQENHDLRVCGFNPSKKSYSNWIISPGGENRKSLKPPPNRQDVSHSLAGASEGDPNLAHVRSRTEESSNLSGWVVVALVGVGVDMSCWLVFQESYCHTSKCKGICYHMLPIKVGKSSPAFSSIKRKNIFRLRLLTIENKTLHL